DDVINMAAHRPSTAKVEAALLENRESGPIRMHYSRTDVSEAAIIGVADEVTGQAVNIFVPVRSGIVADVNEFTARVRSAIESFAAPKVVHTVDDVRKTRSGKIMRRILRGI
ncbi:hypothetical protein DOTSEDRAFT_139187, partial [Dothistroma septosporum NZE10]